MRSIESKNIDGEERVFNDIYLFVCDNEKVEKKASTVLLTSGKEYGVKFVDYIGKTDVCRFYHRQLIALLVSPLLLPLLLLLLQPP